MPLLTFCISIICSRIRRHFRESRWLQWRLPIDDVCISGVFAIGDRIAGVNIWELTKSFNTVPVKWIPLCSVADPNPGSGAFLTPGSGSGIRNRFYPDPGSIPNPYFWELTDKFLAKKFYNFLKTGPNFFLPHFKNKIIDNFVKFVATKKVWQQIFFTPLFCCCFWIRDPGWVKIRIRDPG